MDEVLPTVAPYLSFLIFLFLDVFSYSVRHYANSPPTSLFWPVKAAVLKWKQSSSCLSLLQLSVISIGKQHVQKYRTHFSHKQLTGQIHTLKIKQDLAWIHFDD